VELDIEYRKLAAEAGAPDYRRAGTVDTHPDFINGLAGLVRAALDGKTVSCGEGRICPPERKRCGYD
jgi:ferrochelatase